MSLRVHLPIVTFAVAILIPFLPAGDPGGPSIAVSAVPSSDIYVMRPNGKGLRRVTRGRFDEHSPAFSPTGREIAYVRARKAGSNFSVSDLWVSSATGKRQRRVARGSFFTGPVTAAGWSPEGSALAFTYGYARLGWVDIASRTRDNVRGEPGGEWASSDVEFHPDGNGFIYNVGPRLEIVDGIGNVRRRVALRAYFSTGFDVSSDGRRIVYVRGQKQLWTMNINGTGRRKLRVFRGKNTLIASPTFSPNGKRIAFALSSCRSGRFAWDIYVTGERARSLRRITRTRGLWHRDPDWSDNGLIAFARSKPAGRRAFSGFGPFAPCEPF